MKVKATLYIRKQIWIATTAAHLKEELEVDDPDAQSYDDVNEITPPPAIQDAFDDWVNAQEDNDNPTTFYELDDWGWENLEE